MLGFSDIYEKRVTAGFKTFRGYLIPWLGNEDRLTISHSVSIGLQTHHERESLVTCMHID